jgi:hypothetical protein
VTNEPSRNRRVGQDPDLDALRNIATHYATVSELVSEIAIDQHGAVGDTRRIKLLKAAQKLRDLCTTNTEAADLLKDIALNSP